MACSPGQHHVLPGRGEAVPPLHEPDPDNLFPADKVIFGRRVVPAAG